jgi:tetratricopeptide (TPR) repeat protein
MKQRCVVCGKQPGKRDCPKRNSGLVCPTCCAKVRTDECAGCAHYANARNFAAEKHRKTGDAGWIVEINEEVEKTADDALALIDAGRLAEAEPIVRDLLALYPGNHLAHFAVGALHVQREEFDQAIACFKECVRIFPIFMEAHHNLAVAYQRKLDIPNMVRASREVVRVGNPDSPSVLEAGAFLRRFEQQTRTHDGIGTDDYLKAGDLFDKGLAYMEKGDSAKALDYFDRSAAVNPHNAPVQGNRGICLARLGRRGESLDAFDKALEVDPKYELAMINRLATERLPEGESLPAGPVKVIDYAKEYPLQNKSLIREMYEKVVKGNRGTQ